MNKIKTSKRTKIASLDSIKIAIQSLPPTFFEYLEEKEYIDSNGIVNVTKLVGSRQALGNGTGTSDVYIVEEMSDSYELNYYDGSGTKETIPVWSVTITSATVNYGLSADGKTFVGKFSYGKRTGDDSVLDNSQIQNINYVNQSITFEEGHFQYMENYSYYDYTEDSYVTRDVYLCWDSPFSTWDMAGELDIYDSSGELLGRVTMEA